METTKSSASLIIEGLKKNHPEVISAFLDLTPLSSKEVNDLADALRANKYLTYLNLFGVEMSKSDHEKIIAALKENQSVETLIIDNDMGDELYEAYQDAVSDNHKRSQLGV